MSEILDSRFEQIWHDALTRGQLLVQNCESCGAFVMYPKYRCPHCGSSSLSMVPASGGGVLTSFAVIRAGSPSDFVGEMPYAVGVIRLNEGVQILARLKPDVDGEWDSCECDAPVEFVEAVHGAVGSAPWFSVVPRDREART